ncbi:hypothetical protein ACGGZK_15965 [Agromyces sp. MMS24-K17]|uniref:hypothetical protein n=1 Tax=Agromyces sp. MMS24-K17 TaxID=3372850 RepID=UPI003754912E
MRCRICSAELPDDAMFCGECGSSTSATPESRRRADPRPGDTAILDRGRLTSGVVSLPVPLPPVDVPRVDVPPAETAATPPSAAAPPAHAPAPPAPRRPSFTLRFSTGEVRLVSGTGLVGRRPLPQPGEAFDHLVQIADRTLSVSKTHVEFGEHEGELWVADRFSGNGTIVRRSDEPAVRCEPGRRYLVPRGASVHLAEQSFSVE